MDKNLAFIGAGSMAEAIISGLIESTIIDKQHIMITNRMNHQRIADLKQKYHIDSMRDKQQLIEWSDVIVLATKPCDMKEALASIQPYIEERHLIVSVTAGISTEKIEQWIGISTPVVRAMPNTSASIGFSATALCTGTHALEEHMSIAKELFDTIGTTVQVEEKEMHLVTGISGSGPAYIYYLVEAMEQTAIESGMNPETAKQLIHQTVLGAGNMLHETNETAAELRKKITSPAGTTKAGIQTLAQQDFQQVISKCIYAARDRSIELGE
ncbi:MULTISPECIES: pyrroline-5-carboxylate reductase [Virgibacillus]|uniref:Pyrroline-5-carboxylate reductase n=1 Tax=Virgibacillus dokdonensis TaxID=302167 RepID=A0A2K9J0H3_9BACI|nr:MULTISPECIES: pyrroline-5-carboxylate reductase [Virgibacillus]AUJ24533.1 Pyrroline-5-carboxylate reductase [Virgibacillus dokdonensis]NWO14764.1 pyrroline-5-carboxylate reductase [Virgibacillus sp.]